MYPQYEQDKQLVKCHPSFRQIMINQMEFYVFAHFGVNTFTDREWGDGTEDPAIFNPTDLDARQWVAAVKSDRRIPSLSNKILTRTRAG